MEEKSLAYELIQDARKQNKRTFILLIIVLALWFATIFGFIWYINQFDYVTETTQEMSDINNSNSSQRIDK